MIIGLTLRLVEVSSLLNDGVSLSNSDSKGFGEVPLIGEMMGDRPFLKRLVELLLSDSST